MPLSSVPFNRVCQGRRCGISKHKASIAALAQRASGRFTYTYCRRKSCSHGCHIFQEREIISSIMKSASSKHQRCKWTADVSYGQPMLLEVRVSSVTTRRIVDQMTQFRVRVPNDNFTARVHPFESIQWLLVQHTIGAHTIIQVGLTFINQLFMGQVSHHIQIISHPLSIIIPLSRYHTLR